MAHNIYYDEQKGQHAFFSVTEKAWHGLGKIVDQYPTSAEALRFAGLDYRVEKRRLFTLDNEHNSGSLDRVGAKVEVPRYHATIRTDKESVLGVVGRDYEVVQNIDAFAFFDSIVGGHGIQYETAGALGRGERIFITAKLPAYIKVGSDDLIEQYLFLTTSHDGFGAITAAFTPVRIVCNNTLNAAMKGCSNAVKIRHTASVKERLEQAHKLMGITNTLSLQMEDIFNHWAHVRIADGEVLKLIHLAMAPGKEALQSPQGGAETELSACFKDMCNTAFEYAMTAPAQQLQTTKGTLFGAYNAVTGYLQNVRSYKDSEAKLKSIMLNGTAHAKTQKAFDLCKRFALAGNGALALN